MHRKVENVSLNDFVTMFLTALYDAHHMNLPAPDRQSVWHKTFYRMKGEQLDWPPSIKDIHFDLKGRYPCSVELTKALNNLRLTGMIATDMRDHRDSFVKYFIVYWHRYFSGLMDTIRPELDCAVAIFREEYDRAHRAPVEM